MPENPLDRARADGRTTLTEPEAKAFLAEAGFERPAGETATTPDEAVAVAEDVGYPVVVKVASPAVTHKSEWAGGAGLTLDCRDPSAVRAAAERVLAAAEREDVAADVYVERAVESAGVECVVGGVRRPSFGPTVLVGIGGTFVELFEDVSHRLAPIDAAEGRAMLSELRAGDLLDGYRGGPVADREALVSAVRTVGDLLVEHGGLQEVECNPLHVTERGAVALDALVTLEGNA